jgi:hypothetical protein
LIISRLRMLPTDAAAVRSLRRAVGQSFGHGRSSYCQMKHRLTPDADAGFVYFTGAFAANQPPARIQSATRSGQLVTFAAVRRNP